MWQRFVVRAAGLLTQGLLQTPVAVPEAPMLLQLFGLPMPVLSAPAMQVHTLQDCGVLVAAGFAALTVTVGTRVFRTAGASLRWSHGQSDAHLHEDRRQGHHQPR